MAKEIVCFGEMLWDLLPTGKMPGGAPMNVAIHLTYQGQKAHLVSRICHDELGRELILYLQSKNLEIPLVQVEQTHSTGVVEVNVSNKTEVEYTIVAPAAWDFIAFEEAAAQAVSQSYAFVFGTLSARHETSRQTLLQLLPLARCKVLDVNLRAPFYDQTLVVELLQHATIAKMNHHELALIRNWYGAPEGEQESMRFLSQRFGLELLIVTRGENGALAWHADHVYGQAGFPVEVTDTIGSGDAFLATFLSLYLQGSGVAQALKQACLVGAWVATKPGATPEPNQQELLDLERRHS